MWILITEAEKTKGMKILLVEVYILKCTGDGVMGRTLQGKITGDLESLFTYTVINTRIMTNENIWRKKCTRRTLADL